MAIVTHENFDSYSQVFEQLNITVESAKRTAFNSNIVSSISTIIGNANSSDWNDKISDKIGQQVTFFKGQLLPALDNSIQNDFNKICTLSNSLVETSGTYKRDRSTYKNAENAYKSAEKDEDNSLQNSVNSAKHKLDDDLSQINNYLRQLAAINFNLSGSSNNYNSNSIVSSAIESNSWTRDITFSAANDKSKTYSANVNGIKVNVVTDRKKNPLYYYYWDNNNVVHYYDTSLNDITQEQALSKHDVD